MIEPVLFSRPEGWWENRVGSGASEGRHSSGCTLMKGLFLENRNRCG